MATAREVAEWMAKQLVQFGELYQADAVGEIEERFGDDHVYENANGNPAISKDVLAEFRKLTPDYVWVRSERYWRKRETCDESGRMQDI